MNNYGSGEGKLEKWMVVRQLLQASHCATVLMRDMPGSMQASNVPLDGHWIPALHTAKPTTAGSTASAWSLDFVYDHHPDTRTVSVQSAGERWALEYLLRQGELFGGAFEQGSVQLRADIASSRQERGATAVAVYRTAMVLFERKSDSVVGKMFSKGVEIFGYVQNTHLIDSPALEAVKYGLEKWLAEGSIFVKAIPSIERAIKVFKFTGPSFAAALAVQGVLQLIEVSSLSNPVLPTPCMGSDSRQPRLVLW